MTKSLAQRFHNKEELTVDERKQIGVGNIRINQALCQICNDIITSHHRHDFKWCSCKSLSVDGGSWYTARNFKDKDSWKELSVYYGK